MQLLHNYEACMNVKELIAELQKFPEDMKVVVDGFNEIDYENATKVEVFRVKERHSGTGKGTYRGVCGVKGFDVIYIK